MCQAPRHDDIAGNLLPLYTTESAGDRREEGIPLCMLDYAPAPKGYARFDEFDQPSTLRFMPSISSTPRANHFCTDYLGTSLILPET